MVFDLDDTLYKEQDYLRSAYREIAAKIASRDAFEGVLDRMLQWWQEGSNVFRLLIETYRPALTMDDLLTLYRSHEPAIRLDDATRTLLDHLRQYAALGLITDGRRVTQRHNVEALGLSAYMDPEDILISEETGFEKPSEEPFRHFMDRYPSCTYYYIGDNPSKDFVAPNRLGWITVCLLDDGRNIHPQDFSLPRHMLARHEISHLADIEKIIRKH